MLFLGSYYDIFDENQRHTYLFWPSLRQSFYLSLVSPLMFDPARHYSFGTNRHFTEITRDEIDDITTAMQLARRTFLDGGGTMRALSVASDSDLRAVLGKIDMFGGGWTRWQQLHNYRDLWDAVFRAIREGELIFVPEHEDLRACVKAIQDDRKRKPALGAQRPQDNNPYATVQQMMGKPPRMSENPVRPFWATGSTQLSDAQPFEYTSEALSGDVQEIAASTNNPRYAAKMLGYDQNTFSDMLHVFKPANGLGPADNVIFHDDGSVEFKRRILDDNIHNYAP
ncbi:hypothetical protein [Paraburkholderia unamae]|uniref:Uncharacterized protein n=1 Tax=Paraburkholderia unamae TaxID=219649 RepID=A0ABX5KR44_9BURK|nr:hypothetical protein [Paraburkholderia unamae]PVX83964.1 hypothetical protein C7402_106383 [Paraburkholderia unamae]CAG9264970.1 conserved hypothetical protein [Paraburkholderia unamae]